MARLRRLQRGPLLWQLSSSSTGADPAHPGPPQPLSWATLMDPRPWIYVGPSLERRSASFSFWTALKRLLFPAFDMKPGFRNNAGPFWGDQSRSEAGFWICWELQCCGDHETASSWLLVAQLALTFWEGILIFFPQNSTSLLVPLFFKKFN